MLIVEVAIADPNSEVWVADSAQRVLLKAGDSFFIPPGNIYRYLVIFKLYLL